MLTKIVLALSICSLTGVSFAQVCNSDITETTPITRFSLQGNGTALDLKTNLVWKMCNEGEIWNGDSCSGFPYPHYKWQSALEAVHTLNSNGGFASQTDWRVPNIKELNSIVELSCYDPAINLNIFSIPLGSPYYWSSSPNVYNSGFGWLVYFYNGEDSGQHQTTDGYLRLVRGG